MFLSTRAAAGVEVLLPVPGFQPPDLNADPSGPAPIHLGGGGVEAEGGRDAPPPHQGKYSNGPTPYAEGGTPPPPPGPLHPVCFFKYVSPPRSLFQPASGRKLFSAIPVMHGFFIRH